MRRSVLYISFFLLTAVIFSCKKENLITGTVTVRNFTGMLDGCGMLLQLDNGGYLEPVKLPPGVTLLEGRKAEIRYKSVPQISICMAGPTVEITFLRYL